MKPGSPEAIEAGCTCPRMDNANGRGIPSPDGTLFYYASDCPLHHHGDFPGGKTALARNGEADLQKMQNSAPRNAPRGLSDEC